MQDHPIDRERLVALFFELAAFNSPSRHEGQIAAHVQTLLCDLGADVVEDDAAEKLDGESGNVIARFPGTRNVPALLLSAHLDTVQPTADLQVRRTNGSITSDGTTILGADDKAGVAAILEVLRVLQETSIPRPPLEVVFTVAEEIGVMGSQVMDYGRLTAKYGFVVDSNGDVGLIITRAPAQQQLRITVHGRAAHAGMAPENGVSAITIAARAIAEMRQGRVDAETTANIGVIHGGKATNIVPDTVEVLGEARSRDPRKLDEQIGHMRARFEEKAARAGGSAEVVVSDVYPAFNVAEAALPVRLAKAALDDLGIPAVVTATGGGSDANFFNQHDIETVNISAGYYNPHGTDERLDEEQFVNLARWIYHIVEHAATESA